MGTKTVPRRTAMLLERDLLSPEDMWTVHKENPEKVYGISMD
jgi:TatD-related deoxyribonuclease